MSAASERAGDDRWMGAALALAERGVGRTAPNPPVGCVIVRDGLAEAGARVVGRGWTRPGGRPHAEAEALAQAGDAARGSTAYTTLEPCAHLSERGPACADGLIAAGVARVVAAVIDPDPRTAGGGVERLRTAGVEVTVGVREREARDVAGGFFSRRERGRPRVTLKLALSIDGRIAMPDGRSRWITGEAARAHAHLLRARSDLIVVGRGTLDADAPALDVRLPGLEDRSPRAAVLSTRGGEGRLTDPEAIDALAAVDEVLVEGGAGAAAAFLRADRVDRIVIYRAPIVLGDGRASVADIGLSDLVAAHGRWRPTHNRQLGVDRLEVYERLG